MPRDIAHSPLVRQLSVQDISSAGDTQRENAYSLVTQMESQLIKVHNH